MRRFARSGFFAATIFTAAALPGLAGAQSNIPFLPSVGVKLGYSQGDLPGVVGGVDFKIPTAPIRLDADAWSSFADFGRKSAGTAFTVNYVKSIPFVYVGAGVGYAYGYDKNHNHFDSVAGKIFVGGKVPFLGAGLEGALLFSDHTVGMITATWRF